MTQSTTSGTPYASAAHVYRSLGWRGVLPADLNGKRGRVPAGYTGAVDVDPDDATIQRWMGEHAGRNVALRLPSDVIGIDVDAYDGKTGDQTIAYAAEQHGCGELPPTWSSTARGPDQPSRIWLYRVPAGRRWRADLGNKSGVELIQRGHRWVRVWPSTNQRLLNKPRVDPTYRWYAPDGSGSAAPPRPEELAELSAPWIELLELASGESVAHLTLPGADGSRGRGDFSRDDVPVVDVDGRPVDPMLILVHGAPIGSQQSELFRYMCSLRARGAHRQEMISLGMVAIQALDNAPDRDEWTGTDVIELVDHVRRDYQPGGGSLTAQQREIIDRLTSEDGPVLDQPALVEESATDLGNSLRFARLFGERCRYAEDVERWYVWDGTRWVTDRAGLHVVDLTKYVIDDLRRQAFMDQEHRDQWLTWANTSESLRTRKAMVDGARSEPGLVVTSEIFDADPNLLVVRNGTIDLRTGELRESRPEDLNSQLAEVTFDPEARHERWDAHVKMLCGGDEELVRYLARAVGYTLTGNVGARAFFFLEGTGSNGKNAFIEPIMQLMGSYAQTASPSLLTGSEDKQHETVIADLLGARLVFVDETRQGRALNVERVKALTGSKRVKGRFMRKDYFEFEARFKLWIAGNGRPTVRDPSDGVWTRLHRVVCHGRVAEGRRIERYGDVLYAEESSGILNWALAGLRDWRDQGLAVPASVRADVDEYRHDEDYEAQFVDEWLEITGDQQDTLVVDEVYQVYQRWARDAGLRGLDVRNKAHLGRALGRLGVGVGGRPIKINERAIRVYRSVRWADGAPVYEVLGLV